MKYQVLKRLKTKSKLIKMCESLEEAHNLMKSLGGQFIELSYVGQFPTYKTPSHYYQIQGAFMLEVGGHIVCGFHKEAKLFNYNK